MLLACKFGLPAAFSAGETKYRVADIPKALLKNAKAVVRNEEITMEVKSDSNLHENNFTHAHNKNQARYHLFMTSSKLN